LGERRGEGNYERAERLGITERGGDGVLSFPRGWWYRERGGGTRKAGIAFPRHCRSPPGEGSKVGSATLAEISEKKGDARMWFVCKLLYISKGARICILFGRKEKKRPTERSKERDVKRKQKKG